MPASAGTTNSKGAGCGFSGCWAAATSQSSCEPKINTTLFTLIKTFLTIFQRRWAVEIYSEVVTATFYETSEFIVSFGIGCDIFSIRLLDRTVDGMYL